MKFKNLNYLVIIIYLISSGFAYSIDRPNIKNLIIHKDKKKIENIEIINSKSQKVSLNYYKSNIIIINFFCICLCSNVLCVKVEISGAGVTNNTS